MGCECFWMLPGEAVFLKPPHLSSSSNWSQSRLQIRFQTSRIWSRSILGLIHICQILWNTLMFTAHHSHREKEMPLVRTLWKEFWNPKMLGVLLIVARISCFFQPSNFYLFPDLNQFRLQNANVDPNLKKKWSPSILIIKDICQILWNTSTA